MATLHTEHPSDTIKMLRETLCVAQTALPYLPPDECRQREHMDRLQRLIDDCDRQRPLGPDGKHDDRHTPSCGCEDVNTAGDPQWCDADDPADCTCRPHWTLRA